MTDNEIKDYVEIHDENGRVLYKNKKYSIVKTERGAAKNEDDVYTEIVGRNKENREKHPHLIDQVENTLKLALLRSNELGGRKEVMKETQEKLESVVWDAYLCLDDDKFLDEVANKMAYIYGNDKDDEEAQLRGLFFEAVSHKTKPNDVRIITTIGPEVWRGDGPEIRNEIAQTLEGMSTVPVEQFNGITEAGRTFQLEKGVILGEQIKKSVEGLLKKDKRGEALNLINKEQVLDADAQLPENGFYIRLPKIDGETGNNIKNACEKRGLPYFEHTNGAWKVHISKKWFDQFPKDESGDKQMREKLKNLLTIEFYIRDVNEQLSGQMVVPDAIIVNDDGLAVGIVETKCWLPDEIDEAIVRDGKMTGLTPEHIMHLKAMEARRERTDKKRETLSGAKRQQLREFNLAIKLAEELEFMKNANVSLNGDKILLRFAADMYPGQAEDIVNYFKSIGLGNVYIQILPVTADQTGKIATDVLRSPDMAKRLENKYMREIKGNRRAALRTIKARCLSIGRGMDELKKLGQSPDPNNPLLNKLWEDVKRF